MYAFYGRQRQRKRELDTTRNEGRNLELQIPRVSPQAGIPSVRWLLLQDWPLAKKEVQAVSLTTVNTPARPATDASMLLEEGRSANAT